MRNRYPGVCYRCGERVEVGDGHFERYAGGWRTQHVKCCFEFRRKNKLLTAEYAASPEKLSRFLQGKGE
jgi:hypothetical protein